MITYARCWGIGYLAHGLPSGAGGEACGVVGAGLALPPIILNMTVPQVGHLPLMALRPFFIVSSTPPTISFLALHLTQYPSGIEVLPPQRFMRQGDYAGKLTGGAKTVNYETAPGSTEKSASHIRW